MDGDKLILLEERNVDFGMLFSAGMECDYREKVTFMCKLTYNLIFTKERNEIPQISKLDGLWFFYLADNSLCFHRFLEEKNTWLLEFKSGDLSMGGIFIFTEDLSLFDLGEEIDMLVDADGSKYYEGSGSIVRSARAFSPEGDQLLSGFGIMFRSPTDEFKGMLSAQLSE